MKRGLRDMTADDHTGIFDELGLKYIGPVDGHDQEAVERALQLAKDFESGPVVVHTVTRKGYGYGPAIEDEVDQFHAVGVIDPITGKSQPSTGRSWTSAFGDAITELARDREDIVAITAAMLDPVGASPASATSSRSACSTWASRSSTRSPLPPDCPTEDCTRSSASTRRS